VLHFFLSYARGAPDDNARVQRFFHDLSTEIRVLIGDDNDVVVGFHDHGALRSGDDWPRELFDALCQAQTMIALFSPRYFRSEYCGREWTVFSERVRRWETQDGSRRARLIPIFWVRTKVPDTVEHVQHRDVRFGEAYDREDLRELMREKDRNYEKFVRAVAIAVTDITDLTNEGQWMPPSDPRAHLGPDLRVVPSAFHPRPDAGGPVDAVKPGTPATEPRAPVAQPRATVTESTTPAVPAPPRRPRRNGGEPDIPQGRRPILSLETMDDLERPGSGEPSGDPGVVPQNS